MAHVNQCSLCATHILDATETDNASEVAARILHTPCAGCRTEPEDPRLCDICRHLRLQHLVRCMKTTPPSFLRFQLNKSNLLQHRVPDCPLCAVLSHAIQVAASDEILSALTDSCFKLLLQIDDDEAREGLSITTPNQNPDKRVGAVFCRKFRLHIQNTMDQQSPMPRVGPFVDWQFFRESLSDCEQNHQDCSQSGHKALPENLRLIDVKERCLVRGKSNRYCALSYVWGADDPSLLSATRASMEALRAGGSIANLSVPKTVEDAITMCIYLNERYLWVDRLCIIQDDPVDKQDQIYAMADIFSSAQLVFIAGSSEHMDAGIRGVGMPRDITQISQNVKGVVITNILTSPKGDDANWISRGWTYQEGVLAKRRLFLDNHRALYQCQRTIYREDRYNNIRLSPIESNNLIEPEEKSILESYNRHIFSYTRRRLTYMEDVYDAVAGIIQALYGMKEQLLYGIPSSHFDLAILWTAVPSRAKQKFNEAPTNVSAPLVILPSWSWSSAMCEHWTAVYFPRSFYGPLCTWYALKDHQLACDRLQLIATDLEACLAEGKDDYMALAWHARCIEGANDPVYFDQLTFEQMIARYKARRPESRTTENRSRTARNSVLQGENALHESVVVAPASLVSPLGLRMPQGAIYTRWQAVQLILSNDLEILSLSILEPNGPERPRVGSLDGELLPCAAAHLGDLQRKDPSEPPLLEFGAVSLSGLDVNDRNARELESKQVRDSDGNVTAQVPVLNVFMVRRAEDGTARRLALGYIYLIDWVKLERKWVDVVLV